MCDCDHPEVFSDREVKARKSHRCCECGRTIASGEWYQRSHGIWPDGAATYKTCLRCAELRDEGLAVAGYEDGPCCFTELADWYWNANIDIRCADS